MESPSSNHTRKSTTELMSPSITGIPPLQREMMQGTAPSPRYPEYHIFFKPDGNLKVEERFIIYAPVSSNEETTNLELVNLVNVPSTFTFVSDFLQKTENTKTPRTIVFNTPISEFSAEKLLAALTDHQTSNDTASKMQLQINSSTGDTTVTKIEPMPNKNFSLNVLRASLASKYYTSSKSRSTIINDFIRRYDTLKGQKNPGNDTSKTFSFIVTTSASFLEASFPTPDEGLMYNHHIKDTLLKIRKNLNPLCKTLYSHFQGYGEASPKIKNLLKELGLNCLDLEKLIKGILFRTDSMLHSSSFNAYLLFEAFNVFLEYFIDKEGAIKSADKKNDFILVQILLFHLQKALTNCLEELHPFASAFLQNQPFKDVLPHLQIAGQPCLLEPSPSKTSKQKNKPIQSKAEKEETCETHFSFYEFEIEPQQPEPKKKGGKGLPSEPTSKEKTLQEAETYRTEKEKLRNLAFKNAENNQKEPFILTNDEVAPVMGKMSGKMSEFFKNFFLLPHASLDRKISHKDVINLAKAINKAIQKAFPEEPLKKQVADSFLESIQNHIHTNHGTSEGDLLPYTYILYLRSYFAVFGIFSPQWVPQASIEMVGYDCYLSAMSRKTNKNSADINSND